MPRHHRAANRAILRAANELRNRWRVGLVAAVRNAAPVDTGELKGSIRAGTGSVLLRIDAPHWYYTNKSGTHKGWLSNAIRRFAARNGARGLTLDF